MISFEDVEKFNKKQRQNTFFVAMATTTFVLILFIYAFLSPSKVMGDSMNPTLENGDIVFSLSSKFKQYERGDIVTIDSVAAGKNIIKRIIGIGGDTIRIETGRVYVNGELLKEDYINLWEAEIDVAGGVKGGVERVSTIMMPVLIVLLIGVSLFST